MRTKESVQQKHNYLIHKLVISISLSQPPAPPAHLEYILFIFRSNFLLPFLINIGILNELFHKSTKELVFRFKMGIRPMLTARRSSPNDDAARHNYSRYVWKLPRSANLCIICIQSSLLFLTIIKKIAGSCCS
jgi:hypothetical protein